MKQESRSRLVCLALGLVMALAGCDEEATGSARAVATLPQALSASDVARVELTVSGAGMTTRTDALVKTGQQWGGVLGQLPAGTGRTFSAQAFDASNTVRYSGQVTPVTIQAGQTTAVTLLLQEVNPPAPFDNAAPRITSLVASPATVAPGGLVALQASAEDPNAGDTLTSAWTAGAGSFSVASSLSTVWTAPASPGPVVLTLQVTDSKGASAALSVTVTVGTDTGNAAVNVSFNTWPQVAGVTATPSSVAVGQVTQVTASASDNDGDGLSYQWTASCAGTWTNATSASASFTPSAQPSGGICTLTVAVHDGRGGQGTGSLSIYVGRPTTGRFPPEVVETFQSVATVPAAGGTVVFRVRAKDPQGSALSFTWTSSTGTLGTPTHTATTSEVLWTASACVPSGGTPSVTMTVTNALGLSASSTFSLQGGAGCGSCVPRTCAAVGRQCGPLDDGCGGILECGTCTSGDQCHAASCNLSTGTCESSPRPNGTTCSDDNACTRVDTCQGGVCTGAQPVVCNAPDACHPGETCNPSTGVCGPDAPVWNGDYFITNEASVAELATYATVTGSIYIQTNATTTSIDLPNLTTVKGSVSLHRSPVVSVRLPKLTTIGSSLDFHQNNALTQVDTPRLRGICDEAYFHQNTALVNVNLGQLKSVGEYLYLNGNTALGALDLGALTHVGEYIYLDANNALSSLNVSNLTSVGQSISIYQGGPLTTLDLGNLTSLGSDLSLYRTKIANLSLTKLTTIPGFFYLDRNLLLGNVSSSALTHVGGYLYLDQNEALTSMNLTSLAGIGEYFYVTNNGLTQLGVPALTSVGGYVYIGNNASLPTACATALQSQLTSIGGDFTVIGGRSGPCP
ncbi:Ig-like domain-containing protein [Pyxidicoccus xibeiensis]|uniref:Ig-like domain-containing protein n=1 Tax=Pyxidicoccus xibeiensis TaxID=2906759 RepID=UPI0020A76154|nr:hypothetical protein [Pyxidicoccus xibeiensis]MCP3140874.1 hypothetical protein [Pyxidicoccus xibeiensis]